MPRKSYFVLPIAGLIACSACQRSAPTANFPPAPAKLQAVAAAPPPISTAQAIPEVSIPSEPATVELWTPVATVEPFSDRAYPSLREWTASSGGFHTAAK